MTGAVGHLSVNIVRLFLLNTSSRQESPMRLFSRNKWLIAFFALGIFLVSPAYADKPEWAGNKHEKKMHKEGRHEYGPDNPYFTDHHRTTVVNYYGRSARTGKCPPGLAKKHNGCMPPGQARKWELHKPLPQDVVELGVPPSGYKYVRVGADILMIAIGTQMVVDAITDLQR
jgi:hypothetical protein